MSKLHSNIGIKMLKKSNYTYNSYIHDRLKYNNYLKMETNKHLLILKELYDEQKEYLFELFQIESKLTKHDNNIYFSYDLFCGNGTVNLSEIMSELPKFLTDDFNINNINKFPLETEYTELNFDIYKSSELEESDYSFLLFLALLAIENGFVGEYGDCVLYVHYCDKYNKIIVESSYHDELDDFQFGNIDDDSNKDFNYWFK